MTPDDPPTAPEQTDVDHAIRGNRDAFGAMVFAALIPCLFVMVLLRMAVGEWRDWFSGVFILPFIGAALWPLTARWRTRLARVTPDGITLSPLERGIAFALVALLATALVIGQFV